MNENIDNSAQEAPRRTTARWVWLLLVGSLAANFLIVGAIGGHLWASRFNVGPYKFGKTGEGRSFFRELPRDRKKIIRETLKEHREKNRPLWKKVKEARHQAGKILENEPFNQEDFLVALNRLDMLEREAREASRPMMVQLIKQLKPHERKHFLKIYNRRVLGSPRDKKYRNSKGR